MLAHLRNGALALLKKEVPYYDLWEQLLRTHWAEPTLTDHELFERIYQLRQLALSPSGGWVFLKLPG